MEDSDLAGIKALMAASLLGGIVRGGSSNGRRTTFTVVPTKDEIEAAVSKASDIWTEVLKQANHA